MFDDFAESAKAQTLALNANTDDEQGAAARTVARRAHDKDDLAQLLNVLGLPDDPDTLTDLFPLLPETRDAPMNINPTTAGSTRSAHKAVALSMHADGASEEAIREATGLSETELSDLIADKVLDLPRADALVLGRLCSRNSSPHPCWSPWAYPAQPSLPSQDLGNYVNLPLGNNAIVHSAVMASP
ncbi:hypothetical protein [Streptomyces sp. NPDC058326]|uniref:hypothetical protein n=1 Tax=Streptomyces sp. NPDC058326 TaxID=3346447 RepID=UPI0036E7C00D